MDSFDFKPDNAKTVDIIGYTNMAQSTFEKYGIKINTTVNASDLFKAPGAVRIKYKCYTSPCTAKVRSHAGWYKRKSYDYSKIAIITPYIQSRYFGTFKGLIIANNALMALGNFQFESHEVFKKTALAPMLSKAFAAIIP
jgi:hypothetical protein